MINVVIVGLGRMGSLYPDAADGNPRSHIGAVSKNSKFSISAIVDSDRESIRKTQEFWPSVKNTPVYQSISDLPEDNDFDVIVISTPPDERLSQVRVALARKPEVLIIEKPIALDFKTGRKIAQLATDAGILTRVNFHRRFDESHLEVKKSLKEKPLKIVMYYNKGLFNYAPHLVDLLLDWFGRIEYVQSFGSLGSDNPSFNCWMEEKFEAVIVGISGTDYDQFEIEIFFENSKISLINGGCQRQIQHSVNDIFYPGYKQLDKSMDLTPPGAVSGLNLLYNKVSAYVENSDEEIPGCNPYVASEGLAVLEAVQRSFDTGRKEAIANI